MSSRLLGETLDIHGGGAELIFPHDEFTGPSSKVMRETQERGG